MSAKQQDAAQPGQEGGCSSGVAVKPHPTVDVTTYRLAIPLFRAPAGSRSLHQRHPVSLEPRRRGRLKPRDRGSGARIPVTFQPLGPCLRRSASNRKFG